MAASLAISSWVGSLVEWLAEVGVGLHRPGLAPRPGNPSIIELVGAEDLAKRQLASLRGLGYLAEVHMVGGTEPPIDGLEWVSNYPFAAMACLELRVGQVWSFGNGQFVLYEIIGISVSHVTYITWLPGNPGDPVDRIRSGGTVHIDEANFCHGAGGGRQMSVGAFTHPMSGVAKLVFLSAERHRRSGGTCCTVLGSRRRHPCPPRIAGASRCGRSSSK